MANWQYTLKCGKRLRGAIENENAEAVIVLVQEAYDELLEQKLIDDSDYESYTADFDLYDEDVDEDTADWELDNLYDLCDALRVWIPV